jgi:shikimate dehydrogenase
VRRRDDGGGFDGDEATRVACLAAALDAGARYVDVEWRSAAEALAQGDRARRVILSHHGVRCDGAALSTVHREMAKSPAALLKIVAEARRPAEAAAVRGLLASANVAEPGRLACFALGRAGAITRVLAPAWGSWSTYGAARRDRPTAEGQFTAVDLVAVYDVLGIGPSTRRYALIGNRVFGSPSPAMHAAGYAELGLDARYVPVEVDTLDEFLPLVGAGSAPGFEAFAVTMPLKQEVAARARPGDATSRDSGAVNTVTLDDGGWTGFNTDGPAAVRLIEERLGRTGLTGIDLAIVGAGGTARAIAAAALGSGARVTLFNRSTSRGAAAAASVGARCASLAALGSATWDVLVNATPVGATAAGATPVGATPPVDGGEETIVDPASLDGRLVLDAVYGPRPTPLVVQARARGLAAVEGFDLLVEQAVLQFNRMTGHTPDRHVLHDAGRRWLSE